MIHHISIAANQPLQVAEVLAKIVQGQAIPFPYHPGSYIALNFDPHGTMIEVHPRGTELMPGMVIPGMEEAESWENHNPAASDYSAFHAAISVSMPEAQIHEIARCAGWQVATCDRHGFFSVIEVWIENRQLLEFLPPDFADQYLAFTHPQALRQFVAATPDR